MKIRIFSTIVFLGLHSFSCQAAEQEENKIENMKISYSTGYQVGSDFRRQDVKISPKLFVKGVLDANPDATLLMTPKEMQKALGKLQRQAVEAEQEQQNKLSQNNKKRGRQFLLENAKKPGVTELSSGLQYQIIRSSKGKHPTNTGMVTVKYRGFLLDGTEIDNSTDRKDGLKLNVDRVIKGWSEALLKMTEGAKWRLFIPPSLGFGERAFGQSIPANSTLIYDVELLAVN